MYQVIYDPRKISSAQKAFLKEIHSVLPKTDGVFTIGYQGNNFALEDLRSNGLIWFGHYEANDAKVPRYWNGFGLANDLTITGSNKISTEANVALDGYHPRAKTVGAFFGKDENGNVALIHTGKVGGGQPNVGKSNFLSWYKGEVCKFQENPDSESPEQGILLAELGQENIAESLSDFVKSVAQFKASVSGDSDLSDEELKKKAKSAKKKPKSRTSVTVTYTRDQSVARYAKKRANGKCDLCREPAPFTDSHGEPYLECHHVIWLAHNGEDSVENTVALCPNCHRRMHILKNPKDVKKLQKRVAKAL